MSVGPSELIVILIVVLLLFGSRRIAALGKGIGEGIRGFKRGIAGEDDTPSPQPATKSSSPSGVQPAAGESGANQGPESARPEAKATTSATESPAASTPAEQSSSRH